MLRRLPFANAESRLARAAPLRYRPVQGGGGLPHRSPRRVTARGRNRRM